MPRHDSLLPATPQASTENRTWDDASAADFGPGLFSASPAPEPEGKTRLNQVLATVGDRLDYVYDFGDNWEHHVPAWSTATAQHPWRTAVGSPAMRTS